MRILLLAVLFISQTLALPHAKAQTAETEVTETFDNEREPASQKKKQPAKKPPQKQQAKKAAPKAKPKSKPTPTPKPKTDQQILQEVDAKYQKADAIAMKVDKTLKIGLLGEERKSSGSMWISDGRIRMELESTEKSVLVVNKKNLWAATYPGADFPDAPVQVIKGESTSKKGQSKNALSLLSVGGFLRLFKPSDIKKLADGSKAYTLLPKQGQTSDFKKAQVTVTPDGKAISELKYWDPRDNETQFLFRDVTFDKKEVFGKKIEDKLFDFVPPKNAEIMNL